MAAKSIDADRLTFLLSGLVGDLLAVALRNGELPKGAEIPAAAWKRVRAEAMAKALELAADVRTATTNGRRT